MSQEDQRLAAVIQNDAIDRHAIERAQERYGLEINDFILRTLEKDVRARNVCVAFATERHLECEVILSGVRVRFVYLIKEGRIITFLEINDRLPVEPKIPYRIQRKHQGFKHNKYRRKHPYAK